MNKLKNLLLYILNIPLYLLSRLVSKDEKIWIFGAWFGEKNAANNRRSEYVYFTILN